MKCINGANNCGRTEVKLRGSAVTRSHGKRQKINTAITMS